MNKWNKVYNLTSIRQPEKMVTLHLLDSLVMLTFFSAEAVFDTACPGLITEDFSSTLVAPNGVGSDAGAIDYDTNNSLFALHTIVQGISLWEQASGDMVVLTPPFAGVTSVTVGPNSFADDAVINFSASTNAFGAYIVMPNGGDIVNIEIFGAGGSLGTTSMTGATGGFLLYNFVND